MRSPRLLKRQCAALLTTSPSFPARPAPPPKIICVTLGMRNMLRMKATKIVVNGMRFASHMAML